MRLITPKRLKENEASLQRLADDQIDRFHARGTCEFVGEYAQPYTMLVDRRPARRARGGPRRSSSSKLMHTTTWR